MAIQIKKYYLENILPANQLDYEYDTHSERPAWIHIKSPDFKARFISVVTNTDSEILYKWFTGNFYYPVDLVQNQDEERLFYEKYAQFYDENTSKNNLPMAEFLLNKILALNIPKNIKILDIGAGTGIFSELAVRNGFSDVTLLDIYDSMLNVAKEKTSLKTAKFIVGDAEKVILNDCYDVMVSIMMFDALRDDNNLTGALQNLISHLKPSGYIFIIEDKDRKPYSEYFSIIDKGIIEISKEKEFRKFYIVGKKKD